MYFRENCTNKRTANISAVGNDNNVKAKNSIVSRSTSSVNTTDSEFIYIDLIYHNPSLTTFEPVNFDCTRNVPIVNDVQNYKIGIISVNGTILLPLRRNYESVTFALVWINQPVAVPPTYHVVQRTYQFSGVYPRLNNTIYNVTTYVNFINVSLVDFWNEAKVEFDNLYGANQWDAVGPTLVPGLVYDPPSGLFSLYVDTKMGLPMQAPQDTYNFNLSIDSINSMMLQGIFTSNVLESDNTVRNYLLPYKGAINTNIYILNGASYVKVTQDFQSVGAWNQTNALLILSNSFPTRKETIAVSSNFLPLSNNQQLNILETFPISLSGEYQRLTVFAKPNIDYCDILGNGQLNRIDFSISLIDSDGKPYPLVSPPNSSIIVKVVLSKTMFTSN